MSVKEWTRIVCGKNFFIEIKSERIEEILHNSFFCGAQGEEFGITCEIFLREIILPHFQVCRKEKTNIPLFFSFLILKLFKREEIQMFFIPTKFPTGTSIFELLYSSFTKPSSFHQSSLNFNKGQKCSK